MLLTKRHFRIPAMGAARTESINPHRWSSRVLLVLVLGLFGGLWSGSTALAQEAAPGPAEGEPVDETINYVTITPTLILNIGQSQGGRLSYIKTDVAISVKGAAGAAAVEAHMPAVKNILVMGVSGQDESMVNTAEGRERIRKDLAKELQDWLEQEEGKPYVEEVMFTNFIVQL